MSGRSWGGAEMTGIPPRTPAELDILTCNLYDIGPNLIHVDLGLVSLRTLNELVTVKEV